MIKRNMNKKTLGVLPLQLIIFKIACNYCTGIPFKPPPPLQTLTLYEQQTLISYSFMVQNKLFKMWNSPQNYNYLNNSIKLSLNYYYKSMAKKLVLAKLLHV